MAENKNPGIVSKPEHMFLALSHILRTVLHSRLNYVSLYDGWVGVPLISYAFSIFKQSQLRLMKKQTAF